MDAAWVTSNKDVDDDDTLACVDETMQLATLKDRILDSLNLTLHPTSCGPSVGLFLLGNVQKVISHKSIKERK